MAPQLSFRGSAKKKIETVRREKTEHCRVICICSVTSSIHVLVPLLKVLSRLGTVQVISEDKSVMLLSPTMESSFVIGDIHVKQSDELILMEDEVVETFKDFNYNILITQDFLPSCNIDKFIMLTRRHHYRNQITSIEDRYTPILSVVNPQGLTKEERAKEEETVYVNERLLPAPSYAVSEDYLSTLLGGVGKREF
ncbi:hypothetical protein, partial [Lysinibacillus xylanilyticus]|uniref:hypothetical protein n=1 Tax=Lysinibacillus xylanilyticus TaxID=582475 RepID=UPI0036D9BF79